MGRAAVAGRMAMGWSVLVLIFGVLMLIAIPLIGPDRSYCENPDHPGPCTSRLELAVPGAVVTAIGGWSLAASVGLLRGRRWARPAFVVTFSLWGLGFLWGMIAGAQEGGDPGGVILAFACFAYFAAAAVLAASPD